ncbi:hypothetical protein VC83_06962 [Pseudogymnoascus destructans]|uniref:Uncharacterized protein n=2 Tax=Pseudogymnoascus destructans TaxID=655981 RepID=L8FNL9_PSED2|nr:uncharacterized protein VC83_06962 [Pseudogymnoascus destructans]ELR02124.1 hypothetical protein GMDG_05283 [Pseudogymnoascus destructans 20631-21]OAF56938.1 hypothetical protein VC83_06962 [Pseudogymnoascus destructans]
MGAFFPDPRTQQHVPICNAIEAGDFRQALKLVEKRLAKTSDTYLVALRCFIQSQHDLAVHRNTAYIRLATLSQPGCKEIISDIDELNIYEEAAAAMFSNQEEKKAAAFTSKMRLAAVRANPKKEKLAQDCFHVCVRRSDWDYAQQIATVLEKNFPGNHEYPFWKLTAILTFTETRECDPQKRHILLTVASRIMQTFADATIAAAGKSPLPVRSLQTPQELLLYHRILEVTGQTAARLKAYKDPYIGVSSNIAKGEWVFKRDHVILLEDEGEWQELVDVCNELLEGAQSTTTGNMIDSRGADWKVWEAFITAAIALQTKESHDKVRDQVKSHLAPTSGLNKTYKRNASLANLSFCFELQKDGKNRTFVIPSGSRFSGIDPRQAALMTHLSQYGHTASAFGDVKRYVETFSQGEIAELFGKGIPILGLRFPWAWVDEVEDVEKPVIAPREELSDVGLRTSHVTLQKLEIFYHNCNLPPIPNGADYESIASTIESNDEYTTCAWCGNKRYVWCERCQKANVMRLVRDYSTAMKGFNIGGPWVEGRPIGIPNHLKLLSTDTHPLDDMAIMAAISLIKLTATPYSRYWAKPDEFEIRHGHQRLIQAAALLEFAHSKSAANTQILLLLVKLYSMMGAGSLALRAYNKLNIKQIQGDTLGYIIFDRISSLHPHPVQDEINGTAQTLDPAANIANVQRMYGNVRTQINNNCKRSFEAGSYDSVCQLVNASDKLSRSIGTAITVIELRKIVRMTDQNAVLTKQSQGYDLLPSDPITNQFANNLDYKCYPDFETSSCPSVEMWLRLGPPPSDFRARSALLVDELWMLFRNQTDGKSKTNSALKGLERSFSVMESLRVGIDMTGHEVCQHAVAVALAHFIITTCLENPKHDVTHNRGVRQPVTNITKFLGNLKNVCKIDLSAIRYHPSFNGTLHPLYLAHETTSLVIAAAKFVNSKAVETHPKTCEVMDGLAVHAREVQQLVANTAEKVKVKMNGGGWIDRVMTWLWEEPVGNPDVAIMDWWHPKFAHTPGRWVAQELGQEFCEWWVGEVVDSWKESVIGLAALRVDEVKK